MPFTIKAEKVYTFKIYNIMKDLIDRLKMQAGLTDEQAINAIDIIKNFTKEKFPMFSGAIDKLFDKYSNQENDFLD